MLRCCVSVLLVAAVCGFAERSYPAGNAARTTQGAEARHWMMQHKQSLYEGLYQARLDDPSIMKKSEGASECINGVAGTDNWRCNKIDMVAFFDFEDLCGTDCGVPIPQVTSCDSWGWTDPLDGTEYAIHTMSCGTSFVRLNADYTLPTVVAYMAGLGTLVRGWRDAKTIGNFVYIGSETYDHGLQVFDLTRLRDLTAYTVVTPDTTYMGFGQSHNVVASPSSNTIFGVGSTRNVDGLYTTCDGGLHAVDVSDPFNPIFAGCFLADGYTHDAQCVVYNGPDVNYQGSEVCFNFNEDTLTIVDVTEKANMVQISRTLYDNNQYTHQGWVTEDQTTLLLDDELDEYYATTEGGKVQRTHIWDISDLAAPQLRLTWMSENQVIDHNQYIIGDMVYQANYEEGLRMLLLNQTIPSMTEIAYFVTWDSAAVVDFFGMWNAYPYFASNQLVCSCIEYGLFILRPNQVAIQEEIEMIRANEALHH